MSIHNDTNTTNARANKRFTSFRGLCIWPVSESRKNHYAEICNQNGESVRDTSESPSFEFAEDAIAEARTWINAHLPAGESAPRMWKQPEPELEARP